MVKTYITIRIHHINISSNEKDNRIRRLFTKLGNPLSTSMKKSAVRKYFILKYYYT